MPTTTIRDAFLQHLIGRWELTGQMGDTPLRQAVAARWVLGGLFVEMTCRSVSPAAEGEQPYEAIYYIGYNAEHDRYVLHLLDTFGVPISCVAARGQREGDSIPFIFDYDSGPWTYRFTWQPESGSWSCLQTYLEDGQLKTFATKHLAPSPVRNGTAACDYVDKADTIGQIVCESGQNGQVGHEDADTRGHFQ